MQHHAFTLQKDASLTSNSSQASEETPSIRNLVKLHTNRFIQAKNSTGSEVTLTLPQYMTSDKNIKSTVLQKSDTDIRKSSKPVSNLEHNALNGLRKGMKKYTSNLMIYACEKWNLLQEKHRDLLTELSYQYNKTNQTNNLVQENITTEPESFRNWLPSIKNTALKNLLLRLKPFIKFQGESYIESISKAMHVHKELTAYCNLVEKYYQGELFRSTNNISMKSSRHKRSIWRAITKYLPSRSGRKINNVKFRRRTLHIDTPNKHNNVQKFDHYHHTDFQRRTSKDHHFHSGYDAHTGYDFPKEHLWQPKKPVETPKHPMPKFSLKIDPLAVLGLISALALVFVPKSSSSVTAPPGLPGDPGTPGTPSVGAPGPIGPAGPPGVAITGVAGNAGVPGNPGVNGVPGAPGVPGIGGIPGNNGPPGAPGAPGIAGIAGPNGNNGANGANGVNGVDGAGRRRRRRRRSTPVTEAKSFENLQSAEDILKTAYQKIRKEAKGRDKCLHCFFLSEFANDITTSDISAILM